MEDGKSCLSDYHSVMKSDAEMVSLERVAVSGHLRIRGANT